MNVVLDLGGNDETVAWQRLLWRRYLWCRQVVIRTAYAVLVVIATGLILRAVLFVVGRWLACSSAIRPDVTSSLLLTSGTSRRAASFNDEQETADEDDDDNDDVIVTSQTVIASEYRFIETKV